MILLLAVLAMACSAFDGYISNRRLRKFGPVAEVNLALRQVAEDYGVPASIAVGQLYNFAVVGLLCYFNLSHWLAFWLGTKFGLCLMQLKSLQMESYVERIIFKLKAKADQAKGK